MGMFVPLLLSFDCIIILQIGFLNCDELLEIGKSHLQGSIVFPALEVIARYLFSRNDCLIIVDGNCFLFWEKSGSVVFCQLRSQGHSSSRPRGREDE